MCFVKRIKTLTILQPYAEYKNHFQTMLGLADTPNSNREFKTRFPTIVI
jgi:hypothetical protein